MRIYQKFITLCVALSSLTITAEAVELMPDVTKSNTIVFINGKKYYVHTVKSGDTLYSMAKAYDVSEEAIKECNPTVADGLKLDQSIKVPVADNAAADIRDSKKRKKEFAEHKIRGGETLYSIARDYNISVNTLREDNPGLNPQSLSIGQTIWVRKSDMGSSSEKQAQAEMDAYAENLNKATDDGFEYYVVKPGETVYSLARRFEISEQDFAANNDIAGGLKAGAVIRIPIKNNENVNQMEQADMPQSELIAAQSSDANIIFRAVPTDQPLNIALMLPFNIESKPNSSYVEFYQGFLLGLEKIKRDGRGESKLTVYNTEHNPVKVQTIVKSPAFEGTNLIIGPVYEDELSPVLQYARENSTPVVSPLADIKSVKSPALYQLSPDTEKKYDKINDLINGGRDIYLIYADSFDKEFEGEILTILKDKPFSAYTYSFNQKSIFTPRNGARPIEVMDDILKGENPCLFIVLANKETDVDRILGTISSSKVAITEKSEKSAPYMVLGTSRWGRFNNIDHTTYFNNNVVMISTYHAKRDSQVVREFDSRYIEAYNTLPSLYAYRGYDSAIIFGMGMRSDIDYNMLDKKYTPLQTSYQFSHKGEGDKYVNQEWMRINYNSNYTITIE